MKYPSLKVGSRITAILALVISTIVSCQKETTEVTIDAYAELNPELKYKDGVYILAFRLQEYSYSAVTIRVSADKNDFFRNQGLSYYQAHPIDKEHYGVFFNSLESNKNYYYQIYVKDSQSSKEVYSDVFSFKTSQ